MATTDKSGGSVHKEGSAKATVADQICQSVQSSSDHLHLMQESSSSQAHLMKILLRRGAEAHNFHYMRNLNTRGRSKCKNKKQPGKKQRTQDLTSAPQLKTVSQLLSNTESSQLRSAFPAKQCEEKQKETNSGRVVGTTITREGINSMFEESRQVCRNLLLRPIHGYGSFNRLRAQGHTFFLLGGVGTRNSFPVCGISMRKQGTLLKVT